ncbi:protein MIS12 homolog [Maniola hyperantus]|uniref:protein MIS12 homolog n=1 Tax=Aphantopus hyperantus TaxID=2795564 RepID=UPI001569AD4F|nr:protein MIS12 homolog [Maniola hyperantus]
MIKTEPWTGGTDEEYETQHFGFGAQRFKIAVRQMVEQKIQSGVKEMESFLKKSVKLTDEDNVALTEACEKLVRMYCERAGPCLDKIDEEITLMLQVPRNVLLPEDEIQLEQTTDEDFEELQREVRSLQRRVEQNALMAALLTAEEEELTSVEKVCEVAKKDMEGLDVLQKKLEGNGNVKNLLNELQFLSASMPFKQECDDDILDD